MVLVLSLVHVLGVLKGGRRNIREGGWEGTRVIRGLLMSGRKSVLSNVKNLKMKTG